MLVVWSYHKHVGEILNISEPNMRTKGIRNTWTNHIWRMYEGYTKGNIKVMPKGKKYVWRQLMRWDQSQEIVARTGYETW